MHIVLKAREYVEEHGLSTRTIPMKILVPMLDMASLEEDVDLKAKWVNMLVNMLDTEANLQNHVFPHILSQISLDEYDGLKELARYERGHKYRKDQYNESIKTMEGISLDENQRKWIKEIRFIQQNGFPSVLQSHEIANLERLGLIYRMPPKIKIEEFETGGSFDSDGESHQLDAEYDYSHESKFRVTDLGMQFIEMCELKSPDN